MNARLQWQQNEKRLQARSDKDRDAWIEERGKSLENTGRRLQRAERILSDIRFMGLLFSLEQLAKGRY